MKRTHRYILASGGDQTYICAWCNNARRSIKQCEYCGASEFYREYDSEGAFDMPSLKLVSAHWKREEIPEEERLTFRTIKSKSNIEFTVDISKYTNKFPIWNLTYIRRYKQYLAKILFGKLIKSKKTSKERRETLAMLSGDNFYKMIVSVYYTEEMSHLIDNKNMSQDAACRKIIETLADTLPEKIGDKAGAVFRKYMNRITELTDDITCSQIRREANKLYFSSSFERHEKVSHTDLSFIESTSEEIQAGDAHLAIDSLPQSVRQIAHASDCWYIAPHGTKLFRLTDELTQVYEHGAWGYDSIDSDQPYLSLVRKYLEDTFSIREDIQDDTYIDVLGEIWELDKNSSINIGRPQAIEYNNILTDVIDKDDSNDESSDIQESMDLDELSFHKYEKDKVFIHLSPEDETKVNKAIEDYKYQISEISNIEEATVEQAEALKQIEFGKLEREIDKIGGDKLALSFDSPYLAFGYSPPGKHYQFIQQFHESDLSNDAEIRVQLFFSMAADITDCTYLPMYEKINNDVKLLRKDSLAYNYNEYKKKNIEDKIIISKFSEEERKLQRDKRILKLRNEGKDEETIRIDLWHRFDKKKYMPKVKSDSSFDKDKTKAQRDLNFKWHHRSNLFKFHQITSFRVKNNIKDKRELNNWIHRNPRAVNPQNLSRWLRVEANRILKSSHPIKNKMVAMMCWVEYCLINLMSAVDKEYQVDAHRIITKDEARRFLAVYIMINNSSTIDDLNKIKQIMYKRSYLKISDKPMEHRTKSKVCICTVTNKICVNQDKCNKRKNAYRTIGSHIETTQRFQLLNSELIDKNTSINVQDEIARNPHADVIFGEGPSIVDILTPMEEMFLTIMIRSKTSFLKSRIPAFIILDNKVVSERETNLPKMSVSCMRYMREDKQQIDMTLTKPKSTTVSLKKQCHGCTYASPMFAEIKNTGGKGHLFVVCETCGQRSWLISEDQRLKDFISLEDINGRD